MATVKRMSVRLPDTGNSGFENGRVQLRVDRGSRASDPVLACRNELAKYTQQLRTSVAGDAAGPRQTTQVGQFFEQVLFVERNDHPILRE